VLADAATVLMPRQVTDEAAHGGAISSARDLPMKKTLTSVALISLLSSGIVLAGDQPPGGTSPRVACKPDVDRLCPGIQRGGGRIVACLKQNEAQLSAVCKDALAKAREKRAPAPPASPDG
jgi:hypothetical protein